MSEGGGRARVAVAGAQRGAELQHSCQPLREEEQRSRTKGKKEDGRSTHEQRRKEKKAQEETETKKRPCEAKMWRGDLAYPYTLLESYGGRIGNGSFDSPGLWKCWGDLDRGGM